MSINEYNIKSPPSPQKRDEKEMSQNKKTMTKFKKMIFSFLHTFPNNPYKICDNKSFEQAPQQSEIHWHKYCTETIIINNTITMI